MHDFRRSAAREMWRTGSTVEECMGVTGHATAAMLQRYADRFTADERRALQRKVQERRRMWREEQITATITRARPSLTEDGSAASNNLTPAHLKCGARGTNLLRISTSNGKARYYRLQLSIDNSSCRCFGAHL
jgi:hypothetical protein